jgi:hypothetical protein
MPQGQFCTGWSFWVLSWRCANGGCNEKGQDDE